MEKENLDAAVAEAKRFIDRASRADFEWVDAKAWSKGGFWRNNDTKASGAIRRASMDLTRALADLRRPPQ